jgi:xylulokinase
MGYLLGLDIGTTTIKAILYDPGSGQIVSKATQPTPVEHPSPELSELNPHHLWQAVCDCLKEISLKRSISALAISSFAEAGLPLDQDSNPLFPIIAWYDQRTMPQAEWWKTQLTIEDLYSITGQRLSPSFGVNKYLWIKEKHPESITKMRYWLSASDYILWHLTGEFVTDYSQASRTMLFDQHLLNWSPKILDLAGLDQKQLPHIQSGGTLVGKITPQAASQTGLPENLPCILGGHDHLCAALAAGAIQPGVVIDSMGTSESTLVVLDHFQSDVTVVQHGFVCYAHVIPGLYILKAGIHAAGGAIEWLARLLSVTNDKNISIRYQELELEAEKGVGKTIGPLWLPHFIGSGTPEADWKSRAALIGAKIDHAPGDLMRGLLESQAFWLKNNLDEIHLLSGQAIQQVILLGGTTRMQLLSKLKASIINLPMVLPDLSESAATGAALLAGLGAGVFRTPQEAVGSIHIINTIIEPNPELAKWYKPIYDRLYLKLYPSLCKIWDEMNELDKKNELGRL